MAEPTWQVVTSSMTRLAWPAAFVAVAALGFGYLRSPPPSEVTVTSAGPTVVRELRALARLETSSLHVEKVIELSDHQRRLHGLVDANDALLFVAAGEVVLGVDLGKLGDGDVTFDPATKTASVTLPLPEIFSARFDEEHSHVAARRTDLLAHRNEDLEAAARRDAIAAFQAAGREPAALEAAKAQAERQLRTLARAWGANDLVVTWATPSGEVSAR
jgi:hypothetical protein